MLRHTMLPSYRSGTLSPSAYVIKIEHAVNFNRGSITNGGGSAAGQQVNRK